MNRMISRVLMLAFTMLLFSAVSYADPSAQGSPPTPASATTESTVAQPPPEAPQDARAMTEDEVATYRTVADSTAQNAQVQEMNVGADVNWTIVLSILVALLIFAVVVAVL